MDSNNTSTTIHTQREYLCDDVKQTQQCFTTADLTFAALASPLIMPKELLSFYDGDRLTTPPHLLQLSQKLRDTPAGQHVLTMYHKHRFGFIKKNYINSSSSSSSSKTKIKKCCGNSPMNIRAVIPKCIAAQHPRTNNAAILPWVVAVIGIGTVAGVGISSSSRRAKL